MKLSNFKEMFIRFEPIHLKLDALSYSDSLNAYHTLQHPANQLAFICKQHQMILNEQQ